MGGFLWRIDMKKLLIILGLALSSTAHAGVNDLYIVDQLCRNIAEQSAFAYSEHQTNIKLPPTKDGDLPGMTKEELLTPILNNHYSDNIKEAKMHEIGQFAINYGYDQATSEDDARTATWTKCMDVMKIYR